MLIVIVFYFCYIFIYLWYWYHKFSFLFGVRFKCSFMRSGGSVTPGFRKENASVSCEVTSWPLTLHLSEWPYCQPYPWQQKDNVTVALYIFWLATCELCICNRLYLKTNWPLRQHWLKLERVFFTKHPSKWPSLFPWDK